MAIQFLYPEGKEKALTFSYDDNQIYDRQLVEIFDRYGMKATFHLNSSQLDQEGFITKAEVPTLYKNHEVACHGVRHYYLAQLTKEQMVEEVWEDRKALEEITGKLVNGMSYAFGQYFDEAISTLKCLGIRYCRTVNSSNGYDLPTNFLTWHPTCHHNDHIIERADHFLNTPEFMTMPLFYIWGHSFEFHREQNWEVIENFCKKMAFKEEVWYATNGQIESYITAMRQLQFNLAHTMVYNPSSTPIWFKMDHKLYVAEPGKTITIS